MKPFHAGKAYIGVCDFGLRCLHPAWAANPRGYRTQFGTTHFDWTIDRVLRILPTVDVTDEMIEATGGRFDYAAAMRTLAAQLAWRKPLIMRHESLGGGYLAIRACQAVPAAQTVFHPRVLAWARRNAKCPANSVLSCTYEVMTFTIRPAGSHQASSTSPCPSLGLNMSGNWLGESVAARRCSYRTTPMSGL
jgi:hypothetical protein